MNILTLFTNPELASAAEKFQSFLDNSSNGVIFFDQQLQATHASKAAIRLFEAHRSVFEEAAPGFDISDIAGIKLSAFSLIPQHVSDGLRNNKSWSRMLSLGTEKFHFTLTPFADKQHGFKGAMLEFWWATEYQKMEEESARSTSVVREMSIPIITCDINRIITSLNPAVYTLLTRHSRFTKSFSPGFDPGKLVGRNIDEFHKSGNTKTDFCRPMRKCLTKPASKCWKWRST